MTAPWTPCDCCGDYLCNIHQVHAHECDCPVIDEWDFSPYEEQPVKEVKEDTNKTRQSNFKARKRKAGLTQCTVWIPENKKAEFLKYVAKLNEG